MKLESACWQEHGQAVDPNLVRLADAYGTVMGKLGDAAADAWAYGAAASAEDSNTHQETSNVLIGGVAATRQAPGTAPRVRIEM